jgi:hypothetical protein
MAPYGYNLFDLEQEINKLEGFVFFLSSDGVGIAMRFCSVSTLSVLLDQLPSFFFFFMGKDIIICFHQKPN